MSYRLLEKFRNTFEGQLYNQRNSTLGDAVAIELFEDLFALDNSASSKLKERIIQQSSVLNRANRTRGRVARRGDGTFGARVPSAEAIAEDGFAVSRGQIATVEIGVEVKIVAKSMKKQQDRVATALSEQSRHLRAGGENAICVGIVGINFAEQYLSFEGDRAFPTDGRGPKHPIQEAADVADWLTSEVGRDFDELLVFRFTATNMDPFPFQWVNERGTEHDYSAALVRISRAYADRFPL